MYAEFLARLFKISTLSKAYLINSNFSPERDIEQQRKSSRAINQAFHQTLSVSARRLFENPFFSKPIMKRTLQINFNQS